MASEAAQDVEVFDDSPRGLHNRWQRELKAAGDAVKEWHDAGEKVIRRFLDKRDSDTGKMSRVNLFHANTTTLLAMLYGRPPQASVSRRFADASDDVARVAGEMLERHLNTDMESDGDGYNSALQYALQDRLLPGFGLVRVHYEAEMEDVEEVAAILSPEGVELAPAVPATQRKVEEDVDFEYLHWKDVRWTAGAKTWADVKWLAFKSCLSREECCERFGEEVGRTMPLKREKDKDGKAQPWGRAEVWEVWDSETEKVYWYCDGCAAILDVKDDPLELEGFFPCPKPMVANATTSELMPRPDFVLAQDLYDEIDTVRTRITLLERAIRVVGVYDKSAGETVRRLVSEADDNDLIPVDSWAMFAEKGGIRGSVDWLPIEQIANALATLRDYSAELIDLLYQVTGMADVMRGQAVAAGTSATEQAIKAKFGSVRVQAMQDDFARFASECASLKAEIISKHFDAATIIEGSNVMRTPDAAMAQQAVALIKSPELLFRVEVKPEAVSLTDFAALKSERMDLLMGLSTFLQAAAPLAAQMPTATPFMLQVLQWTLAGFKGASQIEGVLDTAIAQAQQAAQQPQGQAQQPDPKLLATQMKVQGDVQKEQAKLQADLVRMNAEVQADAQREENQARWNVREAAAKQALGNANRTMRQPTKPWGE